MAHSRNKASKIDSINDVSDPTKKIEKKISWTFKNEEIKSLCHNKGQKQNTGNILKSIVFPMKETFYNCSQAVNSLRALIKPPSLVQA